MANPTAKFLRGQIPSGQGTKLFANITNGALVGALASTVGFVLVELVYLNKKTSQISGKSLAISMISGAGAFALGAIALHKMKFDMDKHPLIEYIKEGAGIGVLVSAPVLLLAMFFAKDMNAQQVMIIASSMIMGFAAINMAIYLVRKKNGV